MPPKGQSTKPNTDELLDQFKEGGTHFGKAVNRIESYVENDRKHRGLCNAVAYAIYLTACSNKPSVIKKFLEKYGKDFLFVSHQELADVLALLKAIPNNADLITRLLFGLANLSKLTPYHANLRLSAIFTADKFCAAMLGDSKLTAHQLAKSLVAIAELTEKGLGFTAGCEVIAEKTLSALGRKINRCVKRIGQPGRNRADVFSAIACIVSKQGGWNIKKVQLLQSILAPGYMKNQYKEEDEVKINSALRKYIPSAYQCKFLREGDSSDVSTAAAATSAYAGGYGEPAQPPYVLKERRSVAHHAAPSVTEAPWRAVKNGFVPATAVTSETYLSTTRLITSPMGTPAAIPTAGVAALSELSVASVGSLPQQVPGLPCGARAASMSGHERVCYGARDTARSASSVTEAKLPSVGGGFALAIAAASRRAAAVPTSPMRAPAPAPGTGISTTMPTETSLRADWLTLTRRILRSGDDKRWALDTMLELLVHSGYLMSPENVASQSQSVNSNMSAPGSRIASTALSAGAHSGTMVTMAARAPGSTAVFGTVPARYLPPDIPGSYF